MVLTGAGGTFSAGGDIAEFATAKADAEQGRRYGRIMLGAVRAITGCRHPVVAAIEGSCIGAGLVLAVASDIRIAAQDARFGIPINRLGFVMSHAELEPLVTLVGQAAALEILLEGRIFQAEEARAMGLVARLAAPGEVQAEAWRAAERIAAAAPLANRWHKSFIRRLADPAPLGAAERDEALACFETEDYRAGVAAFLAKTKPDFKGR